MDKKKFGDFIADNRKAAGLTQKELAERLHVTDKAVSKWERALSYPDVTLLEPLAEALEMGVEELMACRRTDEKEEEQPVRNLLEISRENLRREQRKNLWQIAGAVLVVLAVSLAAGWYQSTWVDEQLESVIVLKETVDGENYIYIGEKGHLIRLKCGEGVDYDNLVLTNERGEDMIFFMDCRWNQRSRQGTVSVCEATNRESMSLVNSSTSIESAQLFGYDKVYYNSRHYYPDPYGEPRGEVFLCDYFFWTKRWNAEKQEWEYLENVLIVRDCMGAVVGDVDRDGRNEVIVRTRWPEKPYKIYDWEGQSRNEREITVTWLDSLPPELTAQLMTSAERQYELEANLGITLP